MRMGLEPKPFEPKPLEPNPLKPEPDAEPLDNDAIDRLQRTLDWAGRRRVCAGGTVLHAGDAAPGLDQP